MAKRSSYIPNRLRKHRRYRGLSQKQVATMLNMKSTNRISRWEQGTAIPSVENLLTLSIIYRRLPTELYFDLYLEYKRILEQQEKQAFIQP